MWGGKGVAIYGGSGHLVQNNYVSDTARYIGLGVGKFGVSPAHFEAPTGSATITGNEVLALGAGHQAFSNLSAGFQATLSGNSWQ